MNILAGAASMAEVLSLYIAGKCSCFITPTASSSSSIHISTSTITITTAADCYIILLVNLRPNTGMKETDTLAAAFDGPHVGVGFSPCLEDPGTTAMEVQCSMVKPGSTEIIITGNNSDILRECVVSVREIVHKLAADIRAKVGIPSNDAGLDICGASRDLHVHFHSSKEDDNTIPLVSHTNYMAGLFIAMVSLLLGKRTSEDLAAVGEVAYPGTLSALDEPWSDDLVRLCRDQGIRRIVVASDSIIEPLGELEARMLEDDDRPTLTFIFCENLLDALPECFGECFGD